MKWKPDISESLHYYFQSFDRKQHSYLTWVLNTFKTFHACCREHWLWTEISFFFWLLYCSIQFTHPEIIKSSGVFLNRSATDFFLTCLAPVPSTMVHIGNFFLFIPADEDAQHSSQVTTKARGFHHPKMWGRAYISTTHHNKAAIHLLLNQ